MNPYLSRDEREQFIRLTCLRILLEKAIDTYSGMKSTDKTFLAELRHSRTRLDKALNIRTDALDKEAQENLMKSVAKLQLMFLPTSEAKKAHMDMLSLKTVLPISAEDFQDWYEFVIESCCKVCARADYEECAARRVLSKYDVFPMDPEAKGKCQYSYADGAVALPAAEVAASVDTVQDTEHEVDVVWDRLPVIIGLHTGAKLDLTLPVAMATNLLYELKTSSQKHRAICAHHVDGELIVVDMQDVVSMQVVGLEDGIWERLTRPLPVIADSEEKTTELERYRVKCKCGTEYFCNMNAGRYKARCRNCNDAVFADRQAEVSGFSDGTKVTLLTNRYRTDKVPQAAEYQYEEPCNPFG